VIRRTASAAPAEYIGTASIRGSSAPVSELERLRGRRREAKERERFAGLASTSNILSTSAFTATNPPVSAKEVSIRTNTVTNASLLCVLILYAFMLSLVSFI